MGFRASGLWFGFGFGGHVELLCPKVYDVKAENVMKDLTLASCIVPSTAFLLAMNTVKSFTQYYIVQSRAQLLFRGGLL